MKPVSRLTITKLIRTDERKAAYSVIAATFTEEKTFEDTEGNRIWLHKASYFRFGIVDVSNEGDSTDLLLSCL